MGFIPAIYFPSLGNGAEEPEVWIFWLLLPTPTKSAPRFRSIVSLPHFCQGRTKIGARTTITKSLRAVLSLFLAHNKDAGGLARFYSTDKYRVLTLISQVSQSRQIVYHRNVRHSFFCWSGEEGSEQASPHPATVTDSDIRWLNPRPQRYDVSIRFRGVVFWRCN
jgi:hypothetical protein